MTKFSAGMQRVITVVNILSHIGSFKVGYTSTCICIP